VADYLLTESQASTNVGANATLARPANLANDRNTV